MCSDCSKLKMARACASASFSRSGARFVTMSYSHASHAITSNSPHQRGRSTCDDAVVVASSGTTMPPARAGGIVLGRLVPAPDRPLGFCSTDGGGVIDVGGPERSDVLEPAKYAMLSSDEARSPNNNGAHGSTISMRPSASTSNTRGSACAVRCHEPLAL